MTLRWRRKICLIYNRCIERKGYKMRAFLFLSYLLFCFVLFFFVLFCLLLIYILRLHRIYTRRCEIHLRQLNSLNLSSFYIYMCMCVYTYICIYVCIYMYTLRNAETASGKSNNHPKIMVMRAYTNRIQSLLKVSYQRK